MSEKMFIVKAIEKGVSADDAFDFIVGYACSFEEAEAACKKLEAKNREAISLWEKHGRNCLVECEAWSSPDDPKAQATLADAKRRGCPFADLELKELFYGPKRESGGFEILCKNRKDWCSMPYEYTYCIEEIERIDQEDPEKN